MIRSISRPIAPWICLLAAILCAHRVAVCQSLQVGEPAADEDGDRYFELHVRPLLVAHCYQCHGAKSDEPRGGLRLDRRDGMFAGGDSGPAVIPGNADESLLIKAVRYVDSDLQMPPDQRLTDEQVRILETWIARGAPYPASGESGNSAEPHWAFQQPVAHSPPPVQQQNWAQNPIDAFILAQLEQQSLSPQPMADKRTLIRRVTYDLIGLPPTLDEIDAFLADPAPDAYQKLVDRLLASPQYGERWARHWLDLVRYSDDFEETWRYRDWLVHACNRDLPYRDMVMYQIAGDLLPAPPGESIHRDGIIATTMLSIGPWGGIDRKKRLADIVDDQIDIIGRTFLGLTLACARCHDHKFDPITTADYYALAGIFYSSRVITDAGYLSHGTKRLNIPLVSSEQIQTHAQQLQQLQRLQQQFRDEQAAQYSQFARTLLPRTAEYWRAAYDFAHWQETTTAQQQPGAATQPTLADFAAQRGLHEFALQRWIEYLQARRLQPFHLLNNPVADYDGEAGVHAWCAIAERPWWGVNTNSHDVAIETFVLPPHSISMYPSVDGGAVAWTSPITGRVAVSGQLQDADPLDGVGIAWAIDHFHVDGTWHELSSGTMLPQGRMQLSDGSNADRLLSLDVQVGDVIYFEAWLSQGDAHYDITNVELTIAEVDGGRRWNLAEDVIADFLQSNPHADQYGNAGTWSFYDMAGSHRKSRMPRVDQLLPAWDEAVARQLSNPECGAMAEFLTDLQHTIDQHDLHQALIADCTSIRSPFWPNDDQARQLLPSESQAKLAARQSEFDAFQSAIAPLPYAHGIQDGGLRYSLFPDVQDVPIHLRGSYEQLGPLVPRGFPGCLLQNNEQPTLTGSGRLELAQWIGSTNNPLAARVMVNRVWQHHFGEGLVRTPSNFGELGERPTHPELLDWLAMRFVASGWSLKDLHRLIVLSATYQQSSNCASDQSQADPQNLLLGRMNRRRLDAEQLRDSLLRISQRCDWQIGGRPVDAATRRRLLYVKTSRADKSGFAPLFDAPDPAIHAEKRNTTTVAPQALELLNASLVLNVATDLTHRPQFVSAPTEQRIGMLFRVILGRPPAADEISIAAQFFTEFSVETNDPLKAWEAFAQTLLVSNEFMYVD